MRSALPAFARCVAQSSGRRLYASSASSAATRRLLRMEREASLGGNSSAAANIIKQLERDGAYEDVVRRVEAHRPRWDMSAISPALADDVAKAYISALVRTGKFERRALPDSLRRVGLEAYAAPAPEQGIPNLGAYAGQDIAPAAASSAYNYATAQGGIQPQAAVGAVPAATAGTATDPIIVSLAEPSARSQFWKVVRSLGLTFLLISGVSTLIEERGLGRGLGVNQEVQPQPLSDSPTKFDDVKGCDEAKAELEEIAQYLRSPSTFTRLGGKLPKGVLLVGPPGTGKTLLARAIAGEADVPFFYASGSEFEEMFVGVGARRVRDLFAAAKAHAPCILFIDEIDAIGGKRNPKDQMYMKMTLNQLLVELDGFKPTDGVIVVGATNFPETLDPALVRPGRFDRNVAVPNPDVEGRRQILEVHTRAIPLGPDVNLEIIARGTPGFSGAELANLANMAALKAALDGAVAVAMSHLEHAKDKILMGAERKSAVISDENRKLTAFHEGGHALVATYTPGAYPVHKATIVPRGQALGMVSQLPDKDMTSMTRKQMLARMDVCMGGRVAEEMIFGKENVTSGASSDFVQATGVAEAMVTKYGMSDKLGVVAYDKGSQSSETRAIIEAEVLRLTDESYDRVSKLLGERKNELHRLAEALLDHETLTGSEVLSASKGQLPARSSNSSATNPQTYADKAQSKRPAPIGKPTPAEAQP